MRKTSAALLAAYMFLLTATLRLGCADAPENMYYAQQAALTLGFLSYALFRRILRAPRPRKALAAAIMTAYAVGAAALFLARNPCAALGAVLCTGHLGGLIYHRLSETLDGSDRLGVTMGSGGAVAYALQFVFQASGAAALLPAAMLAALAALVWLLLRGTERPVQRREKAAAEPRSGELTVSLACACVVTAALVMLGCWYDGYLAQMQTADYGAYDWPRLLLVPFCLLFGFLGDWKGGKYLPFSAFCVALVTLLNPVLTLGGGSYRLNLCLFYIGVAAAVTYYGITFCRLAPRTRNPALWAGMGRVLDAALVVLLGLLRYSKSPAAVATAFDIALLAVIAVVLSLRGELNLTDALRRIAQRGEAAPAFASGEASDAATPKEPADAFDVMARRYGLSDKELRVLRALVLTENIYSTIEQELKMKPSTLRRYVTLLYRKTGVQTRAGLSALYYQAQNEQ